MSAQAARDAEVEWVPTASLDDLWEGDVLDVEANGEPVILVHKLGGEVKAFQGFCPHQELLLADGEWDPDTNVLLCHGHKWEFDMDSGDSLNPKGCRLFEYQVRVEGDQVEVGVPNDGHRHYNRFEG